ncbi:MAG: NAD(P)H-dependent oxidoreductase [Chitinophagaceae bacterium]|nr:NAD(P)H-dependent oxidoreductase [Chitinophagaceae bacterium]
MKIEIITGSPRQHSVTKRVALHLYNQLKSSTNHVINIIDAAEWNLPPLQAVFTSVDSTPEEFRPLSKRIFEADAFILVTPEYNGSYTSALKNILDHFPKQHHKPFGIVTASPGPLGGMRAAQQLLQLVPALFGIASPYLLVVPAIDKKFNAEGQLTDEGFRNNVNNFINEYLWLAESLVKEKETVQLYQ